MSSRVVNISTLGVTFGSEGEQVFVDTVKAPWRHHRGARLPVDHITVENAGDGYQWVRNEYHHPEWLNRQIWHIDFNNGNDEGDGYTLGTSIKTFAELLRRLGDNYTPQQSVDIYCHGDNLRTDPLRIFNWRIISPDPGVNTIRVQLHGNTTTYYSGTFTAVQAMNRATNTPFIITDTNMIGANQTPPVPPPNNNAYWYNPILDPFGNVRAQNHDFQRLRISSGPRTGAVSWTSSDNLDVYGKPGGGANGVMRTSNWIIPDPIGFTTTQVVPQVGDHYVVERLGKLYVDHVEIKGNDDNFESGLYLYDFDMYRTHGYDSQQANNEPHWIADGGSIVWTNCMNEGVMQVSNRGAGGITYFLNSSTIDSFVADSGFSNFMDGGLAHLGIYAQTGAVLFLDAGAMVETGSLGASLGGTLVIQDACAFDQPGHGLKAGVIAGGGNFPSGGTVLLSSGNFYGTSALWGKDDSAATRSFGVSSQEGGRFVIDPAFPQANLTITGVVSDFCIGNSDIMGNRAHGINRNTHRITSPRSCTWTNFFKPISQGGFDGRVIDLETLSYIGIQTTITNQSSLSGPIIYVDPVNGIDHADGYTSITPIKTNAELAERLSAFPIENNFDVYYLSYPPPTDPLRLDLKVHLNGFGTPVINFHAPALSTKSSGTLSAVTTRNRATNTPYELTDGTVTTTGDVGLRMRITGGPRAGTRAWVVKSTGAGKRRTSEWGLFDPTIGATAITPAVSDPYVIEQFTGNNTALTIDYINIVGGGTDWRFASAPFVTFSNFDFDAIITGGLLPIKSTGVALTFMNCRFKNVTTAVNSEALSAGVSWIYMLNCYWQEMFFEGGNAGMGITDNFVDAGACTIQLAAVNGAGIQIDVDCLGQGTGSLGAGFFAGSNGRLIIGSAGAMDIFANRAGFIAEDGLIYAQNQTFYNNGGSLWGTSSSANTFGVSAWDGGTIRYDDSTKLTATGASGDFSIGGQASANAFNATTGVWTTPIACTWANLSGSLLDNAHYPPADARIYKKRQAV